MDERYFTIDTKDLNFIESAQSKLTLTIDLSDKGFAESHFGSFEQIVLVRNGNEYAFTSDEFVGGMNRMTRTAIRRISSHDGVGHCNCSECNWYVDPCDMYCRRCGAMLVSTEYKTMEAKDNERKM